MGDHEYSARQEGAPNRVDALALIDRLLAFARALPRCKSGTHPEPRGAFVAPSIPSVSALRKELAQSREALHRTWTAHTPEGAGDVRWDKACQPVCLDMSAWEFSSDYERRRAELLDLLGGLRQRLEGSKASDGARQAESARGDAPAAKAVRPEGRGPSAAEIGKTPEPRLQEVAEQYFQALKLHGDRRRANAEAFSKDLLRAPGSALSRLVQCLDKLIVDGEEAWDPLSRCAQGLAQHARKECAGDEVLGVALNRVSAELNARFGRNTVRKRLEIVRAELFVHLTGPANPSPSSFEPQRGAPAQPASPHGAVEGEVGTGTEPIEPVSRRSLSPAEKLAGAQLEWALEARPELDPKRPGEAYASLVEAVKVGTLPAGLRPLAARETWTRYVRTWRKADESAGIRPPP